ncbi:MAG TPA: hypothetical protein VFG50_09455 [Rhodothermales bacterium]|nr:hypothetical protein [Rhodothermales bacterium]
MGGYVTYVRQPVELERAKEAEQLLRLKKGEVESLLVEVSSSKEKADDALRKWQARYKMMPPTLTSADVVGYLNDLTRSGFKNFDVSFEGIKRNADYSIYTFNAKGRGYYSSLYRFVWDIENNRKFYRIRNLALDHIDLTTQDEDTKRERMQVMVSFSLKVDAYYGVPEGMSAPDTVLVGNGQAASSENGLILPPVPKDVLPDRRPALNPFFPIVLETVPPNTYGLVDVDKATLVAITDGKAVFNDGAGYRQLGVGDDVYLGQIIAVDPRGQRVVARLNRGGLIDEVSLELQSGERYRQAIGPLQLAPALQ